MAVAITRLDASATDLREAAARTRDAKAARRVLAIALVLEGYSREVAAEGGAMDRQPRRDGVDTPRGFRDHGGPSWGITASEGPGPDTLEIGGRQRRFFDYLARGVPEGPDDGTIAPWAVGASLPFAPEIVLPTRTYFGNNVDFKPEVHPGFKAPFHPTIPAPARQPGRGARRPRTPFPRADGC